MMIYTMLALWNRTTDWCTEQEEKKLNVIDITSRNALPCCYAGIWTDITMIFSVSYDFVHYFLRVWAAASVELHRGESLISPVSVTSCCSSRSVMFFSLFDVCSCIRCSTVPAQCTLHLGCLAFRLFDDQESSSFPLRSHAPALRAPIRPWERKRAPGTGFVIIFKSSQVILAKLMYFFGWICLTSL